MSKIQNEENMQVTGKGLERLFVSIIGTLLGFVLVRWIILPQLTFWQFIGTEFIVMILFGSLNYLFKIKK